VRPARELIWLLLLAAVLRLIFINQAFQLDDPDYLAAARYVAVNPWHPSWASYVFQGELVDMRGHPHPPFNGWFLGLALKLTGSEVEIPLHAIYMLFTLLAVASMYWLARRFTERPVAATLLFIATPAFLVHGNSLEADLPLAALWLLAAFLFIRGVDKESSGFLAASSIALALAALDAYQTVLLGPILALYGWQRSRRTAAAVALLVPVTVLGAYQLYESLSGGALPAAVLAGHFEHYGLQSLSNKVKNALALTAHLGWILFPLAAVSLWGRRRRMLWTVAAVAAAGGSLADRHPLFWISFACGAVVLAGCVQTLKDQSTDSRFLAAWVLLFFAGAVVTFFAGAARYLLPLAPALAMLAARRLKAHPGRLATAFALQMCFGLALAASHYQHSCAYREFASKAIDPTHASRTFLNGSWGFQFYGQKAGARAILRNQALELGDRLITSRLGFPVPFRLVPGTQLKLLDKVEVKPAVPLRVIGISGGSAFSTVAFGLRPFGLTAAPADILTVEEVTPYLPELSYLRMNDENAARQIVEGVYALEDNRYRWMSGEAVFQLKAPEGPARLEVLLYLPPQAAARKVLLSLDNATVAEAVLASPGEHSILTGALKPAGPSALVRIRVDRTFRAPGDQRDLGVILTAVGFRPDE